MASGGERIIICRHAARRSDGQLSHTGEKQSRGLGEALARGLGGDVVTQIVTSTLPRAMQTGEIVRLHSFPGVSIQSDSDLDEQRFHQGESNWTLCLRIQRAIGRLLQHQGVIVVITHSGWIFSCFQFMGTIPVKAQFSPVPLASMHQLVIPVRDSSAVESPGWLCEPPEAYAAALAFEIPRKVSMVPAMWRERPSRTFGVSRVVRETSDWIIKTDVWNMEKHKAECAYEEGSEPLMAISTHNHLSKGERPLACMRDLRHEHLGSLLEIDSLYPDDGWVKFIMYPPWVYRLHIHIHRAGPGMGQLPCRNVHLLKDVISMVQAGVTRDGCMLVYRF